MKYGSKNPRGLKKYVANLPYYILFCMGCTVKKWNDPMLESFLMVFLKVGPVFKVVIIQYENGDQPWLFIRANLLWLILILYLNSKDRLNAQNIMSF